MASGTDSWLAVKSVVVRHGSGAGQAVGAAPCPSCAVLAGVDHNAVQQNVQTDPEKGWRHFKET